jgi:hypothetical protein
MINDEEDMPIEKKRFTYNVLQSHKNSNGFGTHFLY